MEPIANSRRDDTVRNQIRSARFTGLSLLELYSIGLDYRRSAARRGRAASGMAVIGAKASGGAGATLWRAGASRP